MRGVATRRGRDDAGRRTTLTSQYRAVACTEQDGLASAPSFQSACQDHRQVLDGRSNASQLTESSYAPPYTLVVSFVRKPFRPLRWGFFQTVQATSGSYEHQRTGRLTPPSLSPNVYQNVLPFLPPFFRFHEKAFFPVIFCFLPPNQPFTPHAPSPFQFRFALINI